MAPWDNVQPDENGLVVVPKVPPRPGLCYCGCGEETTLAKRAGSSRFVAKGESNRYCAGHSRYSKTLVWRVMPNGCWEWQGPRDVRGYGRTAFLEGREVAHRVTLRLTGIEIPQGHGFHVDHLCENKLCVNPEHLEVVPVHINVRRGRRCKLTEAGYAAFEEEARKVSAWDFDALAEQYGLNPTTAYSLILRAKRRADNDEQERKAS